MITGIKKGAKTGLPPGSLVHVGRVLLDRTILSTIEYNSDDLNEREIKDLSELKPLDSDLNSWVEVRGLHDTSIIDKIGGFLNIHPLLLEDILNTDQRPKFETAEELLFITLKALTVNDEKEIVSEQVSLVLTPEFLVSFQESDQPLFEPVKERLRKARGKIRTRNLDYLLYALIDMIVDHYFLVNDLITERLDEAEEEVFDDSGREILQEIRAIRKEILTVRKAVNPLREALGSIFHSESELIDESIISYYRDVYDHVIQVVETMDIFRETSAELKESYLSNLSYRMNQVMKLLTVIATIFIPLTFIVGIYGMNFQNIPELGWKYGYLGVWTVMLVIFIGMIFYFRRKRWM